MATRKATWGDAIPSYNFASKNNDVCQFCGYVLNQPEWFRTVGKMEALVTVKDQEVSVGISWACQGEMKTK